MKHRYLSLRPTVLSVTSNSSDIYKRQNKGNGKPFAILHEGSECRFTVPNCVNSLLQETFNGVSRHYYWYLLFHLITFSIHTFIPSFQQQFKQSFTVAVLSKGCEVLHYGFSVHVINFYSSIFSYEIFISVQGPWSASIFVWIIIDCH
jgi:hypothetical protein